MIRPFDSQNAALRIAVLATILMPALGACASGIGLQLQADEQNARAAREKLWNDKQFGNTEAIAADSHAYFLARERLLHDRGIATPSERRESGFGHRE